MSTQKGENKKATVAMDLNKYYTRKEAAKVLGVTLDTISIKFSDYKIQYKNSYYYPKDIIDSIEVPNFDDFYTTKEVMNILGYSSSYLEKCTHKYDTITYNGKRLYPKSIVDTARDSRDKINTDNYYSRFQITKCLGSTFFNQYVADLSPITYRGRSYYEKFDIDPLIHNWEQFKVDLESIKTENKRLEEEQRKKGYVDCYKTNEAAELLLYFNEPLPEEYIEDDTSFVNRRTRYFLKSYIHECIINKHYNTPDYYSLKQLERVHGINHMKARLVDIYKYTNATNAPLTTLCCRMAVDSNLKMLKKEKIDLKHFCTAKEVKEILAGRVAFPTNIIEAFDAIYISNPVDRIRIMYDKREIQHYIESFDSYTLFMDVASELKKYKIGLSALETLVKNNNIPITIHPYTGFRVIESSDMPLLEKLCATYYVKLSGSELFEDGIKNCHTPKKIMRTMTAFKTYVYSKRLSKNKKDETAKALAEVYIFLCKNLKIEIEKNDSETHTMLITKLSEESDKIVTIQELAYYLNFVSGTKKYTRLRVKTNETPYTEEEFLMLWNFVYETSMTDIYYQKILKSRNVASTFLYLALHFITIWRAGDIFNVPFPSIELLGFSTGYDLLEWLNDGNQFTVEMSLNTCHKFQMAIGALGQRTQKNDKYLLFEFGNIVAHTLGFLLAVNEAHRRVYKDLYSYRLNSIDHNSLISPSIKQRPFFKEPDLQKGLYNIIGGKFSNRRANKSFINYILNQSEKNENGIGYFVASLMRSHTLDKNMFATATQVYLNNNHRGINEQIALTLFDRGSFGFAKHMLLRMLNPNYTELKLEEQTQQISEFPMSSYEIELTTKSLHEQAELVRHFLEKAITNTDMLIEVIRQYLFGKTTTSHKYTRCLFRAVIIALEQDIDVLEVIQTRNHNCIQGTPDSCIGCPMLLKETLFLYEIESQTFDLLNRFSRITTEQEKEMYSSILYTVYLPILQEATKDFGSNTVGNLIDMRGIKEQIQKLKDTNLIKLGGV